jgi:hypothetical protein
MVTKFNPVSSRIVSQSNYNESILEIFYERIGSTWLLDSLYIFLIAPLNFVGFILNLASLHAFTVIKFHRPVLKSYLKIYTFISALCCFIGIFNFVSRSPRYTNVVYTRLAGIYSCKILQLIASFYLFANILDCLILFERLSNFVKKFKKFSSYDTTNVSILIYLFCFLVSLPFMLTFSIKQEKEFYDAMYNYQQAITFTYCKKEQFFESFSGEIILVLVILIRDIFLLIFELFTSIISIILFNRYLCKKKRVFISLKKMNLRTGNRIHTTNTDQKNIFCKAERFNSKLTRMTIALAICSLLLHMASLVTSISGYLNDNSILSHYFYFLSVFFYCLRFLTNFIFFYYFNSNFRNFFKKRQFLKN